MIETGTLEPLPLGAAFGALILGGAAGWLADRRTAKAETDVASQILAKAETHLAAMPVRDLPPGRAGPSLPASSAIPAPLPGSSCAMPMRGG